MQFFSYFLRRLHHFSMAAGYQGIYVLGCSTKVKPQYYRSTSEYIDFSGYPAITKNFSQPHERLVYLFFLHCSIPSTLTPSRCWCALSEWVAATLEHGGIVKRVK